MLKRWISRKSLAIFASALILVLAASSAVFCQAISTSALSNADPGKAETAVGDLVADAMKAAAHSDIAFIAASDLKQQSAPIPAGKVQPSDIAALLSYPDDPIAVLLLSGSTVRQALERSVSIYPQRNQGFLQVAGLRFSFDPSKKQGERITAITMSGSPIVDDRTYTVAVQNSLADGALGYWKIWTKDSVRPGPKGPTLVDAVAAYFQANAKIDYRTLDRISPVK